VERWKTIPPKKEFRFFAKNQFITTNFCTLREERQEGDGVSESERNQMFIVVRILNCPMLPQIPKCVLETPKIALWHLPETSDARTEYRLLFGTPAHLTSLESFVSLDLWLSLAQRLIKSRVYGAVEAHLDYKIRRAQRGFTVEITGFNQKLRLLVHEVMRVFGEMGSLVSESRFDSEKIILSQKLKNQFTNPSVLDR
jgi:secreted Zn-dependent insulinase-like peptidase